MNAGGTIFTWRKGSPVQCNPGFFWVLGLDYIHRYPTFFVYLFWHLTSLSDIIHLLDTAGPRIMSLCCTLFHCNVDKKKKKLIPSQDHCLCGSCTFSHVCMAFFQSLSLFQHSKHVQVKWTGDSKMPQSKWVCVWMALWRKDVPSGVGPAWRPELPR